MNTGDQKSTLSDRGFRHFEVIQQHYQTREEPS